MIKKIVTVREDSYSEVRALDGYAPGSPAVRVIWGYSTGSKAGLHSCTDTFATAELGVLGDDGEFESVVWEESDYGKRIFAKSVIGRPKDCEGWDPPTGEEADWEDFGRWLDDYCNRVLYNPPGYLQR